MCLINQRGCVLHYVKNDQLEHRHYWDTAWAMKANSHIHSVALLLSYEVCVPIVYRQKIIINDVDGAIAYQIIYKIWHKYLQ